MAIFIFIILIFIPQFFYAIKKKENLNFSDFKSFSFDATEDVRDGFIHVSFKSFDNFTLDCNLYEAEEPKAIVQIIHGALEHKERYIEMINYLLKSGYSCFISDNRGHGKSTSCDYPLGYFKNYNEVVMDNFLINEYLRNKYPGKEIYIFSHSLGSIFARIFLQDFDDKIDKLVMSGPPYFNPLSYPVKFLVNIINFYFGERRVALIFRFLYHDKKRSLSYSSYDEKNLYDIKKDDLMPSYFLNRGYASVIDANKDMHKKSRFKLKNPGLRILVIAGDNDHYAGYEKKLNRTIRAMKRIGYKNIKKIIYKDMKHEIIHEKDRDKVFYDLVKFFDECM
ncbi:alpha/beta fold hydrolase [Peptoniphilus sp.]|jgi:alpha-beta hydrolase superfamily lysophospholipase|uniref:alpha/beta fold hydrolase n=1 Tax=Peptoniphilus sp. TaxID=1971214 RepID=UPI003D90AE6C